jgi:hypothetical protein
VVNACAGTNFFSIELTKYSILPALSLDGIEHLEVVENAITGNDFRHFFQGLLPRMNEFPLPKSVLIIDNTSIHKVAGIRNWSRSMALFTTCFGRRFIQSRQRMQEDGISTVVIIYCTLRVVAFHLNVMHARNEMRCLVQICFQSCFVPMKENIMTIEVCTV